MKRLLLILTIILPLLTVGQNWSPNGATWHYGFSVWIDAGYYKIEYVGDTTITSIQCKKLRKTLYHENLAFQTFDTTVTGTEYTYADTDKVYIFKHNKFYTLYDFSAHVGNTWIVPETKRYNGCDTVGTIRVDSIGKMTINNQNLRYICVSLADNSQKWGWSAKIVEIIGPIKSFVSYPYDYLFPQKFDYCGMVLDELNEGGNFRCYTDNTTFAYSSDIALSCNFITSVNSIEKKSNQIKISPNPSRGSFTVDIAKELNVREIRLTDLLGNIILRQQSNNQTKITIDNLQSGTYILTVIDIYNRATNRKIISCP